jgi:hypothetical protein
LDRSVEPLYMGIVILSAKADAALGNAQRRQGLFEGSTKFLAIVGLYEREAEGRSPSGSLNKPCTLSRRDTWTVRRKTPATLQIYDGVHKVAFFCFPVCEVNSIKLQKATRSLDLRSRRMLSALLAWLPKAAVELLVSGEDSPDTTQAHDNTFLSKGIPDHFSAALKLRAKRENASDDVAR